jgi:hypothetical protein
VAASIRTQALNGRFRGIEDSDVANVASVAATGSEIGVLELAAEDELKPTQTKRARRVKAVPKKRVAAKKARKPIKKKRKRAEKSR